MSRILEKSCEQCKKTFQKKENVSLNSWKDTKFCSKKCFDDIRRMEKPLCLNCKSNFVKRIGKIYCSTSCKSKAHSGNKNNMWKGGQVKKNCLTCNRDFLVDQYRTKAQTCSLECNRLYRKTEEFRTHLSEVQRSKIDVKLQALTQTVSQFRDVLRRCSKYRMWCERIMKRDDFTCQMCEVRGGKLCVDHIKPFIVILFENKIESYNDALNCRELWDIQNGRTLCYLCHVKTPTYGSRVWKTLLT